LLEEAVVLESQSHDEDSGETRANAHHSRHPQPTIRIIKEEGTEYARGNKEPLASTAVAASRMP